jgi:hypothetical protein
VTQAEVAFAAFGLASQALLAGFFAARRWSPRRSARLGAAAYVYAGLGLPLGAWLLIDGQSWKLFVGPLLMAAWALLGVIVDLWRPRPWRNPPVAWRVLIPYVGLYFAAQMFTWWPLWNIERVAWTAYLVLFVVNTTLNLRGHADDLRSP